MSIITQLYAVLARHRSGSRGMGTQGSNPSPSTASRTNPIIATDFDGFAILPGRSRSAA